MKSIIDFVNQAPAQADLLDLALNVPNLDEEFLQFLKSTDDSDDAEAEIDCGVGRDHPSVNEWIDRLLHYHRLVDASLKPFTKDVRIRWWEEVLMSQHVFDKDNGPNGELTNEALVIQTKLARELAPRFANEPLDQSLSFLSEFVAQSQENARLYFWAFYGIAKRYISLREYRKNLEKVMNIAGLDPADRLTFSPVLYRIIIRQEYSVDDRGRFIQLSNPFTDAFEDDNVDVTRIRSCDNCQRIYWAGRRDQRCCMPACNHARHSRLTRQRYAQGYYQGASDIELKK